MTHFCWQLTTQWIKLLILLKYHYKMHISLFPTSEKCFWVSSDQRIIIDSNVAVRVLQLMKTDENEIKSSVTVCCYFTSDNFHKLSKLSNFIFKSNSNTHNHQTFNLFFPNISFLYPLKTSENLSVFWCFQGVEKECIGNEWVNIVIPWF